MLEIFKKWHLISFFSRDEIKRMLFYIHTEHAVFTLNFVNFVYSYNKHAVLKSIIPTFYYLSKKRCLRKGKWSDIIEWKHWNKEKDLQFFKCIGK